MEVELFSNNTVVVSEEEDTVEIDAAADNDNYGGEGERCGICMDIIVDRGVLDCCQHWFCFVCIDNWSSITNLCPLCQNEFQLITCVPVYDTIGSIHVDEDSDSRIEEWCIEGTDNTLAFPSYYIDENAVTCLDGDACKIRSGSVAYEDNSTLDTSIACDSCDMWYHAFCVGFDPEGASVDSWMCPRCLDYEAQQKLDSQEIYGVQCLLDLENAGRLVDTCSGKMSVSVVDAGETAVVVSRVDGEVDESSANCLQTQVDKQSVFTHDSCSFDLKKPLDQVITTSLPGSTVPSEDFHESVVKIEPEEYESRMCSNVGSSAGSSLSGYNENKILLSVDESHHDAPERSVIVTEDTEDVKAAIKKVDQKRKRAGCSARTDEDDHGKVNDSGSCTRKLKARRVARRSTLNEQTHTCISNDTQKASTKIESSSDEVAGNPPVKKTASVDIMSIIQGTDSKTGNKPVRRKEAAKPNKVLENAAGLRVKKIMRRPSNDNGSADVVQRLRKEIREAVRKKSSDDVGNSILDSDLLAAFRVAVSGSAAEPAKKPSPAVLRARKLMLQKSKTRENLTKKIYSTSNGKRKRAWDRDCDVEFWKHRCLTVSKPEKIETLRSVLKLLRKSPETIGKEKRSEEEAKAPILSRLYLADASVFPRKDDIKPVSALSAGDVAKQNGDLPLRPDISSDRSSEMNGVLRQTNILTSVDKKNKSTSSSTKQTSLKPGDEKMDKRKWALEILARKTAVNNTRPTHQNQDNALPKGTYPLLAQLPLDMRPKLAPIRHNKVPTSVRKSQLYRFTEHFLKMENLTSIQRTAATELAVADAINIEKLVADRSNSKTVYLNQCAHELRHRTNSEKSSTLAESVPSSSLPVHTEVGVSSTQSLDSEAEATLRAAGLLSDSPPTSPHRDVEESLANASATEENNCLENGNSVEKTIDEGAENIFDMDSHPDLDIYGDFEYDLDEEDYIGASAIKVPESQPEDVGSKVKVIFSTLCSNKAENASVTEDLAFTQSGTTAGVPSLFGGLTKDDTGTSATLAANSVASAADDLPDGDGAELSLAECEELYGPDEEPSIEKLSELAAAENLLLQSTDTAEVMNSDENKSVSDSLNNTVAGEKSPTPSQAGEHALEEKDDTKVSKKTGPGDCVLKKVEAYIKEHIRPLCKSGVITVEQYRWAVGKTTDKVMKHHSKAKTANFLIKEGEKVKKLAEQYVESAKHKENK